MFLKWLSYLRGYFPSQQIKRRKEELRAILSQKRRILTKEQVDLCSQEVTEQILNCPIFKKAQHVMLYYPIHNEINTMRIISKAPEKTFYLPVTHRKSIEIRRYDGEENLKRGRYGIPEPQTPTFRGAPDIIIVPGVAFDIQLHRMGRGGGYYDRFLRKYKNCKKIGVGYAFQVIENLPTDRHDVMLDQLITAYSK
ncbi:MAG: 5-formyltetrahydrofolate cyclo-ligase [Paludibacter sp.]|nr:5-formyltetrahydrofolate cyclo-ligase [Bacteroidales bacterium]MCM1068443.1 5-formyltetrahydrofolate cyclo-ligase [Prevotella sp.]MCM1353397.1 5-formyltetrahydrofolate cyclo-ligase [Bacteroides sp.]MCM1442558.1 5-formyltetrahydrofolate cyclo-ligase [Muribaculum sp.]MCM1481403.1 5-formyltetrahydrofolate cyclo-ligase [Paludibacter sp.]